MTARANSLNFFYIQELKEHNSLYYKKLPRL